MSKVWHKLNGKTQIYWHYDPHRTEHTHTPLLPLYIMSECTLWLCFTASIQSLYTINTNVGGERNTLRENVKYELTLQNASADTKDLNTQKARQPATSATSLTRTTKLMMSDNKVSEKKKKKK